MRKLKEIGLNTIFSIDIETVRLAEVFEDTPQGYQEAWLYKQKQSGEVPDDYVLADKFEKTASLYAEFSKIVSVSISVISGGELYITELYNTNERILLEDTITALNRIKGKNSKNILVGHAANYFDYPFLCKRIIANMLEIPHMLDNVLKKPWESTNLCTNELWRMGGTGAGSSLQALCNVLNIPSPKVDLVGDEVGKAYFKGELDKIARYCSRDTVAVLNILQRFRGEKLTVFEEVRGYMSKSGKLIEGVTLVGNKNEGSNPLQEPSVFEKIYNTKEITPEDKKELRTLIKAKRLTKRNKEVLASMVQAIFIESAMFKADSAKVIGAKTKEVEELILGK